MAKKKHTRGRTTKMVQAYTSTYMVAVQAHKDKQLSDEQFNKMIYDISGKLRKSMYKMIPADNKSESNYLIKVRQAINKNNKERELKDNNLTPKTDI